MPANPLARIRIDPATLIGTPGCIRVGQAKDGRWWLVRPDDRPFLYRGVCALWMPADYTGSEAHRYRVQWEERHGKDTDGLVRHCFDLLRDRGFNALGEWATEQFWDRGLPYTVLIPIREIRKESNITPALPDIFDPILRNAFEARCRGTCARLAFSKDLVGYYVDNEGGWYSMRRDFVWGQDSGPTVDRQEVLGKERLLLQIFLAADPKHPGSQRAWEWVLARHGGSVAAVAQAWGVAFSTPEEFRALDAKGLALASRAYWDDHVAFSALYVQEYFRFTTETIRRHDPNHLMLGARFGGPPGREVLDAIDRRHVDILSWNCYRRGFRERVEEFASVTRMPQLNGEFSWGSGHFLDWDKFQRGERYTPAELAATHRKGQAALEQAFTHPNLVGYTWYKFCWNDSGPDQPGFNLINDQGRENTFNSGLLRAINARLEGIATGKLAPSVD